MATPVLDVRQEDYQTLTDLISESLMQLIKTVFSYSLFLFYPTFNG